MVRRQVSFMRKQLVIREQLALACALIVRVDVKGYSRGTAIV